MKKVLSMVLAVVFCVTAVSFAGAAQVSAAPSGKPVIEDVDYENNGRVEVDFTTDISVKNLKVTVKDSSGKTYKVTSVRAKDDDEISFRINGLKKNKRYTFTMSGVKKRYGDGTYTTVSGSIGKVTRIKASGAEKAAIEKIEYEGGGLVEVDFKKDVNLRKVKVTVKDSSGRKYAAKIVERDEDELDFRVIGIKADKKYTVTLANVKSAVTGKTATLKATFRTKKISGRSASVVVKEVEYDPDDRELSIDFKKDVNLWNAKVKVTDAEGKSYKVKVLDYDDDELEVRVYGLTEGASYRYSISGVYAMGSGTAKTVKGTFAAVDDDDNDDDYDDDDGDGDDDDDDDDDDD